MRYEITGDPLYKDIGAFFMDVVNSSHSYATGGTSVGEFWSDPKRLASTLQTENEESCTTYNMLKVSLAICSDGPKKWLTQIITSEL
uniref:Non-reducing end beta-L-arabinofuranosidase-like GH127 catalytic domain-containing protein n=1 Tax=Salix viminalis TaxID=40686 RepID=A0A6N2LYI3_SALVM